uniref:BY PROTMAP: gi/472585916/gb/EMS23458.1/ zinc finger, TRAF-type domain containing protein [Rhodosporidium toruloides NP11] n=1 Tax=Rhodotorula toruloides TaxID=5286 RepID=A0A0K3CDT1_RHOTO
MGIPLDRFKFSWEVQDFVKCAGCRQVAYEPYFICPNEHVKCAACIQPPAAPVVGAAPAPPPAGPVATNCSVCSRAILAQPRLSPLLKRTIETRTVIYSQLSTHYDTCPEKKIECPQGGKDCGGRSSHGFRKRRLMPKHLETECAQWKCRATQGCPTKTTSANLDAHEKACRVANAKIAQLEQSTEEKQAANELLSNEIDRLSKIAVLYDELMEKRTSMIDSTTMTDKEVAPAVKASVSTQGVKRSLRLASKRGPPDGSALDGASASTSSSTAVSTADSSRLAKTRRTEA